MSVLEVRLERLITADSTSAFYLADAGLENAIHVLDTKTIANRSACSGLSLSNTAIGNGVYAVSSSGPDYVSSPTTLNGALSATATTIPVLSTTNYQSTGRIMIDRELINYSGTDATHFLYAQRGVDSTTATTHTTGTSIGQYQCSLTSLGGVPALTVSSPGNPGGKRIVNENVQLEEAWAVGNSSGATLTFARWNRPTEVVWNNASVAATAFNLRSISMLSYTDGWAVGVGATFYHWNGSTWSGNPSGLANVTYNSVFCFSSTNCHLVGNMANGSSATPTIIDYNGVSVTAYHYLGIAYSWQPQNSVHCAAANDCWSVGGMGLTTLLSYFYHWNGSAWSSSSLPIGFLATDFPFNGVYCTSTSSCWAVGASNYFALWNGTNWTRTATGMPSVQYNDIYCNSASDCWAVGNASGQNIIIHWNGSTWSHNTSYPTPAVNLYSIRCRGSNNCWAAGAANTFLHWDGNSWVKISSSAIPNVDIYDIAMLGPSAEPGSVWTQSFG